MCIFVVRHLIQSWKNSINTSFWPLTSYPELSKEGTLNSPAAAAKSLQSCLTLCDPIDGQPTSLRHSWDSPGMNTGVGCHFLLQCMKVKNESKDAQSCLTLSDPMDCSLPGSSVHGIFQARVLEWGAIAFSINSPKDSLKQCDPISPRMMAHWHRSCVTPTEQIAG